MVPALAWADEEEDRAVAVIKKSRGYVGWGDKGPNAGKKTVVYFLPKTDIDAVMRELKHLKHLNTVRFEPGMTVLDEQLQGLIATQGIKNLRLGTPNLTDKALVIIARLKNLE